MLLLPKYLDVAELETLVRRSGLEKYTNVHVEFVSINNKLQKLMVTYSLGLEISDHE